MNYSEVPKLYKCFLTGEIMEDPVVAVLKGEIYDRSSLSKIFKEEIDEKFVVPLPGLKTAIEQYRSVYSQTNNQLEEVSQHSQESTATYASAASSNSEATLQNYKKKVEEVKQELKVVSTAFEGVQKQSAHLRSTGKNLKDQSAILQTMSQKIGYIDVHKCVEDVWKLRKSLVESQKGINLAVDSEVQLLSEFSENKSLLEQKMVCLEKKEEELKNVRENLSNTLKELGIQHSFTTEFEAASKNFIERPTINENDFMELIKDGHVSYKNVVIKFAEDDIAVEVSGEVVLQNLVVNCTQDDAKYIKLIISDPYSIVTIQNCSFTGISLFLESEQGTFYGDIVVRNTEVKNAPSVGIYIQSCNKCGFENVKVDGYGKDGICLSVNESSLEDVQVENCEEDGVYIENIAKPMNMQRCSVQNCKEYGVRNESSYTVVGEDVTFGNNSDGNVEGQFEQK